MGADRSTTVRSKPLYTAEQRERRDASPWTLVQGVLAPVQFLVFLVSLALVVRFLSTGQGQAAATLSIVAKTLTLYTIMITGAIWEKVVFGRYLFAAAFFWEDVFSMLVLALHTAYLAALVSHALGARAQMAIALAAYSAYVVNAGQFVLKLRAARLAGGGRPDARGGVVVSAGLSACAAPPAEARVISERGQREVFCGLTGVVWLHRKIQDAFFLVVGSRTCAHLLQSAAGVMIFAEPRFATAILEERDLAGMADIDDELDRVTARLLERRRDIKLLFLVGSCPSEVIKIDLARAAQRLDRRHAPAVRVLSYSGSGDRDDLHRRRRRLPGRARRANCPPKPPAPSPRCWSPARSPTSSRTSSSASLPSSAFGNVRFLPMRRAGELPPVGPATRVLLAQPFLAETARALEARGAQRLDAAFPLGAEGTTLWLKAAADAFGVAARALRRRDRARAARAPKRRSRATPANSRGKRIFFFPDSQLEIPLARFLSRELGMRPLEVASPYIHRQLLGRGTRPAAGRRPSLRGPGRRAAARPLPRRAAGPHGLRPRPRQSAGGRGPADQMVDRTPVHADPGLRTGRRSRGAVRAPARAPRAAGGLGHAADALDLRRTAARRRHACRHRHDAGCTMCCTPRRATPTPICCSR